MVDTAAAHEATLGIALLGCGRIGGMHAGWLRDLPGATLQAVYDSDTARAKKVADSYGGHVCDSAAQAVGLDTVDAVMIASTTSTHADYIELVARAGKACFCEKPIDLDIARVHECAKVVADNPVPVQIGFNRRFDPGHAAAKKALDDGQIGNLLQVVITSRMAQMPPRSYYETAGGMLRDSTIHDLDLARFFLGEEPVEIFAAVGRLIDPRLMDELDDHDSGMLIMRTASGRMCHINNGRSTVYGYDQRIELHGDLGMVQSANRLAHGLTRYGREGTGARTVCHPTFDSRFAESFVVQLESFIAAIAAQREPAVSFNDGLRALQLAEAAYESVATGRLAAVSA